MGPSVSIEGFMEVELLVTKRDDQQGEYRAICLGKVGRQSFAIDESFVVLIAMFCPQVLVSSDSPGPKAYQRELGRYFGALPVDKKIDITYDKPGYRRGKWVTVQGTSSPLLTLAEIRVYGSKIQIISYCSLLVLTAVKKARLTSELRILFQNSSPIFTFRPSVRRGQASHEHLCQYI